MVAHTCNPGIWDAGAEGLRDSFQCRLYDEIHRKREIENKNEKKNITKRTLCRSERDSEGFDWEQLTGRCYLV